MKTGVFEKEFEVSFEKKDENSYIVKKDNKYLMTVFSQNKLDDEVGLLVIKTHFQVELGKPYTYGQDADGNRGVSVQDFLEIKEQDLTINELKILIELNAKPDLEISLLEDKNTIDFLLEELNDNVDELV